MTTSEMPPHDMVDQIAPAVVEKEEAAEEAPPLSKEYPVDNDDNADLSSLTSVMTNAPEQGKSDGETLSSQTEEPVENSRKEEEQNDSKDDQTDEAASNTPSSDKTEEKTSENKEEEEGQPTRRFGQRLSNLRKTISERRASAAASASLASEAAATQAAKAKEEKEPSAVEKEMGKLKESDLQSMRASKISATVVKNKENSYGFALLEEKEEDNKPVSVKIDVLVEEGLLSKSPLNKNDKLITVNNKKVKSCDQVMEDLVAIDGPVTLVVETPKGNPSVVHAFCQKPSPDSLVGIGFHVLEHGDHKLLQINYLDSNGLLAHSSFSQGDLVLAINDTPCAEKTPEEAAALILESTSTVTILALNPTLAGRQHGVGTRAQRWMRSAKRAGVAIGGGTMVGVGLIFIPTLPPPFGEVLIVGGVSVLGTEFEAPKRLVRSTRDALERSVGRNDASTEGAEGNSVANSDDTPTQAEGEANSQATNDTLQQGVAAANGDDDALASAVASTLPANNSNTTQPKRTARDRMKSFGRNYVLPFLDQVVGDKKHEEAQSQPSEGTESQSAVENTADADLAEDDDAAAKWHAQNHELEGDIEPKPSDDPKDESAEEATSTVSATAPPSPHD